VNVKDQIISFLVNYGFQILGGAVILACGVVLAHLAGRLVRQMLGRVELELPIRNLLVTLAKALIIALTAVLTVAKMGVDIAPIVATMGVVGVGVGLATQGVLSNMVAGLTIMFAKPFRVGEFIELLEVEGIVGMVGLFSTQLLHFDKSIVVIPNRKIVGEILHNYGMIRQLDLSIGVAYDSDLDRTESAIRETLARNPRVLRDPPALIGVSSLDDSSVTYIVKPWVKVVDYVAAPGELYSGMVKAIAAAGIEMPFPQREIRILNDSRLGNRVPGQATAGI
jgi:small conductance mechanosensitive channel